MIRHGVRNGWVMWMLSVAALAVGLAVSPMGSPSARESSSYKELQIFTEVLSLIEENYVNQVEKKKLVRGAIEGLLRTLDPHTSYLSPEFYKEMQVETSGQFGGLGIEITIRDGILTVVTPIEDTPAFRAGVKAGDRIMQVEGRTTKDMTIQDAVRILRGKPGTAVTLTIARKGEKRLLDIKVQREVIRVKSVRSRLLPDGIGYIRVRSFQGSTGDEVRKALGGFLKKGARGLVLDLRNNPGGLLSQAVAVSDIFLEPGKLIVYTQGRLESNYHRFTSTEKASGFKIPIAVLVNAGSASASEIVAGAFQDLGRATVIGERSFGKGSVQTIVPLSDGSGLRLTTALYYTPKGRLIQGKGIQPDIVVAAEQALPPGVHVIRELDLPGHLPSEEEKNGKKSGAPKTPPARRGLPQVPGQGQKDIQLERAVQHLKAILQAKVKTAS
ncbi:MAG: S41 family peptidase [bacterium]|nr:S41 family peptidase [bacterium]